MLAATRGVVLDVRRVRAPRLPRVAALLLGIGLVAAAPRAEAQSGSPHLSLDRFQPTPGSGRILAIPTSRTMPLWGFAVDLAIDYAKGPLGVANGGDLVAHQLTGQLLAAIGFGPVDLGLAVPATLFQSPGSKAEALLASPIGSASFGDMRLNLKVRLTPQKWIGGLALEAIGQFPTGNGKRFSGEDGYGITARAIGDVTLGRVGLAAYFGYRYRSTAGQLWNLYVSDELLAGLGLTVNVVQKRLWVFFNGYGSFGFRSHDEKTPAGTTITHKPDASTRPLELLVGLQFKTPVGITLAIAGGPGIGTDRGSNATSGYGSPELRVLGMIGFESEALDRDGDGIPDLRDKCPREAGPASLNGCPETPAPTEVVRPRSPVEAVTPPPPPPSDVEGGANATPSKDDEAAAAAEKKSAADAAAKRSRKRVEESAGDDEGDGAGDVPRKRRAGAASEGNRELLSQPGGPLAAHIYFKLGRSRLEREALPALNLIVSTLKEHSDVERVVIEGHADETGAKAFNYKLSLARAEQVQRYLMSHGVDSHRLAVRGFGSERPLVSKSHSTEERAINRRVEFRLAAPGEAQ